MIVFAQYLSRQKRFHSQKQLVLWAVYVTAEFYACTSALTPDGGLINGVGALSKGKHLRDISLTTGGGQIYLKMQYYDAHFNYFNQMLL